MGRVSEVRPLHKSPRQLALVIVVFVVILGVPVGLFLRAGKWEWAVGFLGAWCLMVLATAGALRRAVKKNG